MQPRFWQKIINHSAPSQGYAGLVLVKGIRKKQTRRQGDTKLTIKMYKWFIGNLSIL